MLAFLAWLDRQDFTAFSEELSHDLPFLDPPPS
jgi:hypothetical protein